MEIEKSGGFLKKIRVGQLEPILQREVMELASEMGYESTVTASSNLHFLYRLCTAEETKEKRSREQLKKAEKLILKLASLHHEAQKRERKAKKEPAKKIPLTVVEAGIKVSEKTRKLLNSIGIRDEKTMAEIEGVLGADKIGERVEIILASTLEEAVEKFFAAHPDRVAIPDDERFVLEIEKIETKKQIIDNWRKKEGRIPIEADYLITPGILLGEYHTIARLLNVEMPEEVDIQESEKRSKYRGRPMHPDDFRKVVEALGFSFVRPTTEGVMMRRGDVIMGIQKAHAGQMELSRRTIKRKIMEARISPDEFERARGELKL